MSYYPRPSHTYIPGIDGLRAVAVLSVVIFHFRATLLPGGFSGVDVFFVISGYVVSASLANRQDASFGSYLIGFYARRIVRIFPALLVCLLITALFTSLLVPSSWLSETTARTGMAAVFGLSNFALVLFSDGYFAPRAEFNPFTHSWSLAVEEQFYVVFPLLFYIWCRAGKNTRIKGTLARLALPISLVASFVYCVYETSARPDLAYYMLPSRFWELACGAMLFRMNYSGRWLPASEQHAGLWIGVGSALIGLTFTYASAEAFPFPWALPAVLGSMLVIAGSVRDVGRSSTASALIGCGPMTYVGKISYSLYLWHWPVVVLLRWTIGVDSWALVAGGFFLSFGLAVMSYHVIEQGRWWRGKISGWRPYRTVASGIVGVMLCSVVMFGVLKAHHQISLSVTSDRKVWYPEAWPSSTPFAAVQPVALATHQLFVWGDSHAGAYSTMLQALKEQTGVQITTIATGGCAVAGLQRPAQEFCPHTDQVIEGIKRQSRPGDIVFLASLRVPRLRDQWGDVRETISTNQDDAWAREKALQEADEIVRRLEEAGLRVVIDAPKPIFAAPPFRCSDRFNKTNPVCEGGFDVDRSVIENYRKPILQSLAKLKELHPRLVVWDPLPALCSEAKCSAFDGTRPLFFDGDHLSAHGNRVLYPAFLNLLTSIKG